MIYVNCKINNNINDFKKMYLYILPPLVKVAFCATLIGLKKMNEYNNCTLRVNNKENKYIIKLTSHGEQTYRQCADQVHSDHHSSNRSCTHKGRHKIKITPP